MAAEISEIVGCIRRMIGANVAGIFGMTVWGELSEHQFETDRLAGRPAGRPTPSEKAVGRAKTAPNPPKR